MLPTTENQDMLQGLTEAMRTATQSQGAIVIAIESKTLGPLAIGCVMPSEAPAVVARLLRQLADKMENIISLAATQDAAAPRVQSYSIGENGQSITCLRCGKTSYNANDVQHKFCGHCKEFH